MTDKEQRNNAYLAEMCIDCRTVKHSAGRPRCNTCHNRYAPNLEPNPPNPYPCRKCEQNPTRPGSVLCQPCWKSLRAAK